MNLLHLEQVSFNIILLTKVDPVFELSGPLGQKPSPVFYLPPAFFEEDLAVITLCYCELIPVSLGFALVDLPIYC